MANPSTVAALLFVLGGVALRAVLASRWVFNLRAVVFSQWSSVKVRFLVDLRKLPSLVYGLGHPLPNESRRLSGYTRHELF